MNCLRLWQRRARGTCLLLALAAGLTPAYARQTAQVQTEEAVSQRPGSQPDGNLDKAQAYYHYTLGHLYQERGAMLNRPDLLSKAIEELKLALQYDPTSSFLGMELADLYTLTGRWRNALQEAEDALNRNPDSPEVRKFLGRLYLRLLADERRQQVPADLQQKAIQQFEQIVAKDPNDTESQLILAQLYRAIGENAKAEEVLKNTVASQPDSAEASTQLALLYVDMGDYRGAIELLKKVTAQASDPQVLATLAYAYGQIRDFSSAASTYESLLEKDPGNLTYRKALGQSLLFGGKYEQARAQFQSAIQANPRDAESYLRLSQVYRAQHNYDLARENLGKAIELEPDNLELQYNQALLAEEEGKIPEAVGLIQKILDSTARTGGSVYTSQEKSNRGIFLEKLGTLHRDQVDFDAAESTFKQMVELGGDVALRGNVRLLETYQEDRQYEKAVAVAEKATEQSPQSRELAMARASLLASLGEVETAVDLLEPFLNDEDSNREIWLALAQVYLRAKEFHQATDAVGKAQPLSETDDEKAHIHFLYGSIWERQKQYDKAAEEFRRALALSPDSAMTSNYLGYMYAEQGIHLDEAVRMIQRALEDDPHSGAYLDSLGWAYFKQNRLDLAEQHLRKAAARLPNDPTIRGHLGDVFYQTGQISEAQTEWETALQEWKRLAKNEVDPEEVAQLEKKLRDVHVRLAQEGKSP